MRAALLTTVLVAACGGEHVVGSLQLCCYDVSAHVALSACAKQTLCACRPELCGGGAACRDDNDCPALPSTPKDNCIGCISGQCALTAACAPRPPAPCTSDSQCNQSGGCATCGDGSKSCYVVRCLDGVCTPEPPSCGCGSDADCALSEKSCARCPDGLSERCLASRCAGGTCLVELGPPCAATARCLVDADCGTPLCISCPTGTVCGSVFCGAGSCQTILPAC
jgi:hypothetical protein